MCIISQNLQFFTLEMHNGFLWGISLIFLGIVISLFPIWQKSTLSCLGTHAFRKLFGFFMKCVSLFFKWVPNLFELVPRILFRDMHFGPYQWIIGSSNVWWRKEHHVHFTVFEMIQCSFLNWSFLLEELQRIKTWKLSIIYVVSF